MTTEGKALRVTVVVSVLMVVVASVVSYTVGAIIENGKWARAIIVARYERDNPLPERMCDRLGSEDDAYRRGVEEVRDRRKRESDDIVWRRERTQRYMGQ